MTDSVIPIEGLIFDLDGLLVDSEPLAAAAMIRFLEAYGRQVDPAIQKRLLGRRLVEAVTMSKEEYGLPGSIEALTDHYGRMRMEALKGSVQPLPGGKELIARARELRLPVALATSGLREHATLSLEETGLAGLFDAEATGDEVTRGKPAPDLFLLAADRLGIEPEALVVFEDSPLGIEAASVAGMRSIAVQGSRPTPHEFLVSPTASFANLDEARAWLDDQPISVN